MRYKIFLLQDIANEGDVYFKEHNCDLYISEGKNETEIVEEIHKIQPDALCARNNKITAAMKLSVQVGDEERTIVSGIAEYYDEEALKGKNVVVIANLKPVKLRGIESKGMLLAASDGAGHLVLVEAPGIVSGSRVK